MATCKADGCERDLVARGWCLPHYKRWRRRGTVHDLTTDDRFFSHVIQETGQVNTLRGETLAAKNASKTECDNGHPFDEVNTYLWRGKRGCRTCRRAAGRRNLARRQVGASVGG